MKRSGFVCLMVVLLVFTVVMPSANAQDEDWEKVVAAAKKEGVVVAASSVLNGGAAVTVMNAFQEKFGIKLEFFTGRVAAATEKIKMEQKTKSYVHDAMDSGGMNVLLLKKAGYLQSVAGGLPVLREKDKFTNPVIADPEGEILNILGASTLIFANTNIVKPEIEPKSWYDLLDSRWKGKIMLLHPLYTSGPEEQLVAFTKSNTLDESFFVKLYQNSISAGTSGGDAILDKLSRGEIAISGFHTGSGFEQMRNGAPIKPLDFKEGHVSKPMRWGLIKNAPHPNAAKVFINWFLSKEGQALVTKATDLDSIRNDVTSPAPVRLKGPTLTLSFDDLSLATDRRKKKYMATLVGLER